MAALIYSAGQDRDLERNAYSHIAACAECTTRVGLLREGDREVERLLASLDVAAPAKSVDSVIRAAQSRKRARAPGVRRVAAVVAFLIVGATVATAAIPASALHRWLVARGALSRGASVPDAGPREGASAEAVSPAVSFPISPGAALDVEFDGNGVGGSLDVRVIDGDQVSLSSPTAGATYRVSTNRIAVVQSSSARFELQIPRSLGSLRVRVARDIVYESASFGKSGNFRIQLTGARVGR
jgi:hypothetical protein